MKTPGKGLLDIASSMYNIIGFCILMFAILVGLRAIAYVGFVEFIRQLFTLRNLRRVLIIAIHAAGPLAAGVLGLTRASTHSLLLIVLGVINLPLTQLAAMPIIRMTWSAFSYDNFSDIHVIYILLLLAVLVISVLYLIGAIMNHRHKQTQPQPEVTHVRPNP